MDTIEGHIVEIGKRRASKFLHQKCGFYFKFVIKAKNI